MSCSKNVVSKWKNAHNIESLVQYSNSRKIFCKYRFDNKFQEDVDLDNLLCTKKYQVERRNIRKNRESVFREQSQRKHLKK